MYEITYNFQHVQEINTYLDTPTYLLLLFLHLGTFPEHFLLLPRPREYRSIEGINYSPYS